MLNFLMKFPSDNQVGEEGATYLGDGISKLQNLIILNLDIA
jgi:hypothetical protein